MLLDLGEPKSPAFDTFVIGKNQELVHLLHRIAQREAKELNERCVYLWGEPGAGKSHLLRALAATPHSRYLPAKAGIAEFAFIPETTLYLLDDCEQLPAESQIAAFGLFNQVREQGAWLIAAGLKPPLSLPVREDLRTRFGWGLIYHLHGLTDEEKIAALTQTAHARSLSLSPGVLPYLITHFRRDMQSLCAMLDALDRYSLETKRPITLPLLRDLLQLEDETKSP